MQEHHDNQQHPEPDYSVCGRPIIELLGYQTLDEHIERAATIALENPKVGIAVCIWRGELNHNEFQGWVRRQRELLAAWRATMPTERKGRLRLRTRSVVRPGENIVTLCYVDWTPAKVKALRSVEAQ